MQSKEKKKKKEQNLLFICHKHQYYTITKVCMYSCVFVFVCVEKNGKIKQKEARLREQKVNGKQQINKLKAKHHQNLFNHCI